MSNLTLSRDSWHARYYRWFYDEYSMPESLCPYFWILLVAFIATPFFLPFVGIAYAILYPWMNEEDRTAFEHQLAPTKAIFGAFITLGLVAVFAAMRGIILLVQHKHLPGGVAAALTVVATILLTILGIQIKNRVSVFLYRKRHDNPRNNYALWCEKNGKKWDIASLDEWRKWNKHYEQTRFWAMVRTAIKAWYKRSCPLINWKYESVKSKVEETT